MRLGDLIEWSGQRWIVRRIERPTRTALIYNGGRFSETIPDDLDKKDDGKCRVVANPPDEWPFVTVTQRPRAGRLLRVERPSINGERQVLVAYHDWVVADPTQPGGAIFLNPSLQLRQGETLLVAYETGSTRSVIPRNFQSTVEKAAKGNVVEDAPKMSIYDHIRRNVRIGQDEDDDD